MSPPKRDETPRMEKLLISTLAWKHSAILRVEVWFYSTHPTTCMCVFIEHVTTTKNLFEIATLIDKPRRWVLCSVVKHIFSDPMPLFVKPLYSALEPYRELYSGLVWIPVRVC